MFVEVCKHDGTGYYDASTEDSPYYRVDAVAKVSETWYTAKREEARQIAEYMASPHGGYWHVTINNCSDIGDNKLVKNPTDWL